MTVRSVLIAYVLIVWLGATVFLHRASAPRTRGRRVFFAAATADAVLAVLAIGSIWRDWTS